MAVPAVLPDHRPRFRLMGGRRELGAEGGGPRDRQQHERRGKRQANRGRAKKRHGVVEVAYEERISKGNLIRGSQPTGLHVRASPSPPLGTGSKVRSCPIRFNSEARKPRKNFASSVPGFLASELIVRYAPYFAATFAASTRNCSGWPPVLRSGSTRNAAWVPSLRTKSGLTSPS